MPQFMGKYGATLHIDLSSIQANWKLLASMCNNSTVSSVVKANCYGLGISYIVPALASIGCKEFFSATIDEAIEIKKLISDREVNLLFGVNTEEEAFICLEKKINPVINHLGQFEIWQGACKKISSSNNVYIPKAWFHIDTGMSRLGIPEKELEKIIERYITSMKFPFNGVISHLACAEEPEHPMNCIQLKRFRLLRDKIINFTPQSSRWSLANSSGTFLGNDYHFNLTRPGASLYGLNPTPYQENPMKNIVTLYGKILQVQQVDRNQTVGYGATHTFTKPGRIATVGVGYADGYMRSSGGISKARLGKISVPIIGRVSMDLITLDISEVPEGKYHLGCPVELIGKDYTADDFARDSGTIGEEVLTTLGNRYERVWNNIDTPVKI